MTDSSFDKYNNNQHTSVENSRVLNDSGLGSGFGTADPGNLSNPSGRASGVSHGSTGPDGPSGRASGDSHGSTGPNEPEAPSSLDDSGGLNDSHDPSDPDGPAGSNGPDGPTGPNDPSDPATAAPTPPDGPRRVKSVSRLYLLLFLLLILAGSTMQALFFEAGVMLTQLLLILLPALLFLRLHKQLNRDFTRLRLFPLRQLPSLVIIMVSALVLVLGYGVVLGIFLERMGWSIPEFLPPPDTLEVLFLYFFLIALLPGICEEFLFRGAIMPTLESHGLLPALFFSSLLFALFHLSLVRFPGTFILGFVIGLVVLKTGSLLAGMFLHTLNNAVAVSLMYFASAYADLAEHEVTAVTVSTPASAWLVFLLVPAAAAGLYFGFKKLGGPSVLLPGQRLFPRGWVNVALLLSLVLFVLMAVLEVLILSGALDQLLRIFLNAR